MQINIPEDFVEGTHCLRNEIPWQVPKSIYKEAEYLQEDDIVLEVGSGGSTLFFARRCKFVTSIETNEEWSTKVLTRLSEEQLVNAATLTVPNEETIITVISEMNTEAITVFSVDPEGNFNRSNILNAFLSKGIHPALRMIVMDNYSHEGLFPLHQDKLVIDSPDWDVFTYDHPRWAGSGTRLYIKKSKQ